MAQWLPRTEVSTGPALINAGMNIGLVLGLGVSALTKNSLVSHWHTIFYICGVLGGVWCLFWLFFVTEFPGDLETFSCVYSNQDEIIDIQKSRNILHSNEASLMMGHTISYGKLLKNRSFVVLVLNHFAWYWAYYFVVNWTPFYLTNQLGYGLEETTYYSAIPFIISPLIAIGSGVFVDCTQRCAFTPLVVMRRLFQGICMIFPAALFIVLGTIQNPTQLGSYSMLTAAIACLGFGGGGYQGNYIDLSKEYAGWLFGFSSTIGTVSAISVYLPGFILYNTSNNWTWVFIPTAIIMIIASLFYCFYAKAEQVDFGQVNLLGKRKKRKITIPATEMTD
eukprot:TRINITY_DN4065_c0_g1_i1.p1 TRINITY_DN4065_c0_g1~~TRINITY_DN4065_c0_g1_i1.p1  ORF type:complete len:336 (-),score=20.86 TRINITY_DN4065_c0_g1_i1:62-1069(-)